MRKLKGKTYIDTGQTEGRRITLKDYRKLSVAKGKIPSLPEEQVEFHQDVATSGMN